MRWLITLLFLATIFIGGFGTAGSLSPARYQIGVVQPFQGLVCRSQESAMHIFNTWMEVGADKAKEVFNVYQSAQECGYLTGYSALFIEKIISSIAANLDGEMDNVMVFSVSPNVESERVDYLVTWENVLPDGDVI